MKPALYEAKYWKEIVIFGFGIATILLLTILPTDYLPYTITLLLLFVASIIAYLRPSVLLYIYLITSALAGLLSNIDTATVFSTSLSISGLRWIILAINMSLILIIWIRKIRIPKYFVPFFLFAVWGLARLAISSDRFLGFKDVLFYIIPPLTGVYALFVVSTHKDITINRLIKLLSFSTFLPIGLYSALFPFGLITYSTTGPEGVLHPRPLSLYLLIALSYCLAEWKYGDSLYKKRLGLILSILTSITIFFTLSRVAIITAIGLLMLFFIKPGNIWKVIIVALVTVMITIMLILNVPFLRGRFFYSQDEIKSLSQLTIQNINTSGRIVFWPETFNHAIQKPIFGWGPGTARILVAGFFTEKELSEYHPHNEYLQIFHDLGMIGLLIFGYSWLNALFKHWQQWKHYHYLHINYLSKWNLAAMLSITAVLVTAITDNTLHYAFVTGPVFIIIAFAYHYTNIERHRASAFVNENIISP